MPPQVDMGGHHIVLLKTVANETHTTIPENKKYIDSKHLFIRQAHRVLLHALGHRFCF